MSLLIWLALSTLASEDLACIAAGLLVAEGKVPLVAAIAACLAGIFGGDLLLMLAGRLFRAQAFSLAGSGRIEEAREWMLRRGPIVALLSRFTPGLRLPAYLAAGAFSPRPILFAFWMLLACLLWVPLLVGASAYAGEEAAHWVRTPFLFFALAGLLVALRLSRTETRSKAVAALRRLAHWEFWPVWLAYAPVAPYVLWLAFRHRSLTLFTVANPGIYAGGFCDEQKSPLLAQLEALPEHSPTFTLLPGIWPADARLSAAAAFMTAAGLTFPVVAKPERGERGSGVAVLRQHSDLAAYFAGAHHDVILQEYVPGLEFGVYVADGRVLGITEKVFPVVTGNGVSTVEQLVRLDPRARLLEGTYRGQLRDGFTAIPPKGHVVPLVEIGAHCLGAIFLDGRALISPELERSVQRVAGAVNGFFLGRLDVRAGSAEDLRAGRFRVLEVNGVTGEPTFIYDPNVSLLDTYAALFRHWRLAFEIGARNRRMGVTPMPPAEFFELIVTRLVRRSAVRRDASLAVQPN